MIMPTSTKYIFGNLLPPNNTIVKPIRGKNKIKIEIFILAISDINYSLRLFISSTLTFAKVL